MPPRTRSIACRTVAVLTWAALTYGALTCPKRSSSRRRGKGHRPLSWSSVTKPIGLPASSRRKRRGTHPRLEVRSAGRRVNALPRAGHASATPLGRRQASAPACAAGQPPLTASPGTRSVAAALASSRRTEPASRSYIRRGSRPPRRGSTSGAKRPPAGLMARRRYQVGGLGGVFPGG